MSDLKSGLLLRGVPKQVLAARQRAELIVGADEVQFAVDRVAVRLSALLAQENPFVVCVMQGGLPYTGELVRRLHCPLQLGYVHVGRYRGTTHGGQLDWIAEPQLDLSGRHVLLVDDILDEGVTLAALVDWANAQGARRVTTTVLVHKVLVNEGSAEVRPVVVDFPVLQCPDRYLFGCGMDYRGYWRNLPSIYALPLDMEDSH